MGLKPVSKKGLFAELFVLTIFLMVLSHFLFRLRYVSWINEYISVIIALLLLYIPIMVLWKRGREIDFLDRSLRGFVKSVGIGLLASVIILPPFFLTAHFWQIWVGGYSGFHPASPSIVNGMILFQLFLVALPEEFYFRGYFQSGMNLVIQRRWNFLGAQLGWGWIITAAVFALAHSIIFFQWWHFAIFFPALVFGYLREKTGSITAPIVFHALSNILMSWFARCYV
jgi:membrane protease YdiL (CAAX protease family)